MKKLDALVVWVIGFACGTALIVAFSEHEHYHSMSVISHGDGTYSVGCNAGSERIGFVVLGEPVVVDNLEYLEIPE